MCDFSETCKNECLQCSQYCDDDDCKCDNLNVCNKSSCENVIQCINYEELYEKCSDIPEKCLTTCKQFMGCSVANNCLETETCQGISNSLYDFSYTQCITARSEECKECDEYHMCYECDATCESTCAFVRDNECDDGGHKSSYNECKEGTDCEDCGARLTKNCSAIVFSLHSSPSPEPPPYFPYLFQSPVSPLLHASPLSPGHRLSPLLPLLFSPPSSPYPLSPTFISPTHSLFSPPWSYSMHNISQSTIVCDLEAANPWIGFAVIILCFIIEIIYLYRTRKTNIPNEVSMTLPMETL